MSGYEVETFTSGHEFLNSLKEHQLDCSIVDLHLPGLSGLEVQHRLAQARSNLPCIIITGKDEPGVRERALEYGAAAYLKKPVEQEALFAAIEEALGAQGRS
jgi:FixJ family two-component response regulator